MALADSVPGVSGGTVAFLLGFYDKFITSLDHLMSGTKEENIALLKKVITAQKDILKKNNLSDAPQVLTVYKEVEDYWHGTN